MDVKWKDFFRGYIIEQILIENFIYINVLTSNVDPRLLHN